MASFVYFLCYLNIFSAFCKIIFLFFQREKEKKREENLLLEQKKKSIYCVFFLVLGRNRFVKKQNKNKQTKPVHISICMFAFFGALIKWTTILLG